MNALLFLAGLLIFEAFADILAKKWQLERKLVFYFLSLSCYLLANASWLLSLRLGMTLAKGGMVFAVTCAVLAVVIGMAYKEPITRLQMTGFILGLVSLVFIFWSSPE